MVPCKTCNEPTADGKDYCSHSCAVEADILVGGAQLPEPPKLPGFAALTSPDAVPRPPEAYARLDAGGVKHDDGKIPLHLLPFDALIEIAKVLQFGAKKYAPNNWRKGIVYSRLFRAAIGHLISWWRGQDLDEETGLPHLAHAGCCVLFLLHYALQGADALDDRKENNI